MTYKMEDILKEVSSYFFLANAKIAETESLGIEFPTGCLYTTFNSFDILASIGDNGSKNSSDEDIAERMDQVIVMLLSSYVYASLAIGSYYYDRVALFDKEWRRCDLSRYFDNELIEALDRQREKAREIADSFEENLNRYPDDDLLQVYDELLNLSPDERMSYLCRVDEWSMAYINVNKAQENALPIYQKARSSNNTFLTILSWLIRIISVLLVLISIATVFNF